MLLPVLEGAKLGEEHIIRRLVLGVVLEYRPLEVLHGIRLAVEIGDFGELLGNRVTLLHQATILPPVLQEPATYTLPCFRDEDRAWGGVGPLVGSTVGVFLFVPEGA